MNRCITFHTMSCLLEPVAKESGFTELGNVAFLYSLEAPYREQLLNALQRSPPDYHWSMSGLLVREPNQRLHSQKQSLLLAGAEAATVVVGRLVVRFHRRSSSNRSSSSCSSSSVVLSSSSS